MPAGKKYSKTVIIKVTPGADVPDSSIDDTASDLQRKTKADAVIHIDDTNRLAQEDLSGARVYLHGHNGYMTNEFGGREPKAVAKAIQAANIGDAKLISITGCNAARGPYVRGNANALKKEMRQKTEAALMQRLLGNDPGPAQSDQYPGVNQDNYAEAISHDPRLVDTTKPAITLARGSTAHVLHKALMDDGISVDIHARLYVASIERDGRKDTMSKSFMAVDPELGTERLTYLWMSKAEKSKIKISENVGAAGDELSQTFEYVDYPVKSEHDDGPDGSGADDGAATTPNGD
ncbi:MAG: hypothetical protein AAGF45_06595 [Pseudomonadota bacterium]